MRIYKCLIQALSHIWPSLKPKLRLLSACTLGLRAVQHHCAVFVHADAFPRILSPHRFCQSRWHTVSTTPLGNILSLISPHHNVSILDSYYHEYAPNALQALVTVQKDLFSKTFFELQDPGIRFIFL